MFGLKSWVKLKILKSMSNKLFPTKYSIKLEGSNLKLIPHPKKELKILASEISTKEAYSNVFPSEGAQDILYISLVSHTIGHDNKNDCLILPDEGMASYKTGIEKPLNIEHERTDIVGFCLNAFLTNMKNNKILSDEEAQEILDNKGMVNVGNVFAVWKLNHPDLVETLEENFDENSSNFGKVKASFEYYFNDYSYFISNGTSDYPHGEIVSSDAKDSEKMFAALRINGGNGKYNGNRISICPKDGFIGGVALTMQPANEFSDLTGKLDTDDLVVEVQDPIDNNIEQKSVIKDTGDLNMKETPKQVEASVEPIKAEAATAPITVDKDMAEKLQSQLSQKITEMGEKDKKVQELEASVKTLTEALEASKSEAQKTAELAKKIQEQLDNEIVARKAVEAKAIEAAKLELISSRLEKIKEFIEISDANKALLTKECAEASDEEFSNKLDFYKSISKRAVASTEKEVEKPDLKASVAEVVTETAKETKSVSIITSAPSNSLRDDFAKVFDVKAFGYKIKD